MQQNLTPSAAPTLRTYKTPQRAAAAAQALTDVPFVVCPVMYPATEGAGGGKATEPEMRFSPVFLPSEAQVYLVVGLAHRGFNVVRN